MSKDKDENEGYEVVGQTTVERVTGNFIHAFSQHKCDGDIDGVKFTIASNLDGSIAIDIGDKPFENGGRYIVRMKAAVMAAYEDYKKRR